MPSTSFEPQPTLSGELLLLRPLQEEDFPALYAAASDPLIWAQHPSSDRYQEGVFRAFFRDAINGGGALVAIDRGTGEIIGSSRFVGFAPPGDDVEVGYTFLARRYWGGRYNGEMKQLMLNHAFRWFPAVRLMIGPSNIRSQKAAEKIGAQYAGIQRTPGGEERVVYRVTAP
jgi:N-acetyltransferase